MKNKLLLKINRRSIYRELVVLNLFILFMLAASPLKAQYFNKVTTGALVEIKQQAYSATWADVNNDGFDDILILDLNASLPNVLYMNNGDGTFTANAESGMADHLAQSIAASWGDFNNDGFLDVYICNTANEGSPSQNFLFQNDGDGSFTRITTGVIATDASWSLGAAWADYDRDGHIDLYVANFDGNNNLYRNLGDGTFEKITEGEIVTDLATSYGAYWADYDNDGWPDLFVANAFGTTLPPDNNALYKNNGDGTFTKITEGHIVNNDGISHGASWGDFNNDGFLDLFVSNHDWSDNKSNFLYKNNGDGTFTYMSGINVTTDQNTSFGSAWLDADNDGHLDLVVANNKSSNRSNFFYLNNGDASFSSITTDPVSTDLLRSFGVSISDYNNDGYADVFVVTYSTSQENGFYENAGGTNNWIALKLEGTQSNRSAIGARINLWIDGAQQIREVASASGEYSSSSFTQNFGVGASEMIDSIVVKWPSGIVNTWTEVAVNQHLTLVEESALSDEAEILSLTIPDQHGETAIDSEAGEVMVWMPYGYDLTLLEPVIVVSEGASIDPASGQGVDFSQGPVLFLVTAENGTDTREWEVTVQNLPNTETEILSCTIAGQIGETIINGENHTIEVILQEGSDVTALVVELTLSPGATVEPASGTSVDFSQGPVTFTVTAEDGETTAAWEASVSFNVGTPDLQGTGIVQIYPNPTSGLLHIETPAGSEGSWVELFNLAGESIHRAKTSGAAYQMDIHHLRSGVYFLRVQSGTRIQGFKIIKE